MIGDIIRKDMITDINPSHAITMRQIELIHNNTTAVVQTAMHNNNVTVVTNISLDTKTMQDKIINKATIIEEITEGDPLVEGVPLCNLLEEPHMTTGVDLELEKVRKKLSHILDIQNKTQEVAGVRHAQMTCHALQDNVGQLQ